MIIINKFDLLYGTEFRSRFTQTLNNPMIFQQLATFFVDNNLNHHKLLLISCK